MRSEPGHFLGLCVRFSEAVFTLYKTTGGRKLPKESIDQRLNICYDCTHFTGRKCDICECCVNGAVSLFNKLAYPTEHCPEGKW